MLAMVEWHQQLQWENKATCLDRHLFRAHCSSTLLSQTYILTWKLVTPWNIQGVVLTGRNKIPFIPEDLCISQVMNVFVALLDMEVLQKLRSHFAGWFMDPCKKPYIYRLIYVCLCFMIIIRTIIRDCILLDPPDHTKIGQFCNTQTLFFISKRNELQRASWDQWL